VFRVIVVPSSLVLAAIAILGADGCGSQARLSSSTSAAPTVSDAQQVKYTRLYSSWRSHYPDATEQVLQTPAELSAAWGTIHGPDTEPVPTVDFSRQMVVLIALGQRSTGGYSLRFDGLSSDAGTTVVRYTLTSPGPGCMAAQVLSSPVELVAVPKAAGPLRFDKTLVVARC
jgi:PrcB C-terminal